MRAKLICCVVVVVACGAVAGQQPTGQAPKLADAWLDQAFIAWWWHGDAASAFRAFNTALQLDPN